MYQIFGFLSIFDCITPIIGFVEDFINDPTPLQTNSWTFFIPYDTALGNGWNAVDIEDLLDQHGIKHWGSQITNGDLFFSVKREQAAWAEYLLLRNRIPIQENSLGAPRVKGRHKPSPRKNANPKPSDPLAAIDKFLDDLLR